jgi:hypothetical protein
MNRADTNLLFDPLRARAGAELDLAVARFERRLRRVARAVAEEDVDLAEDLYEVSTSGLWDLNPERFDQDDHGYLWRAMRNSMLKYYRDNVERDLTRSRQSLRLR